MEHTHASVLELEVIDADVGIGGEFVEECASRSSSGSLAAEFDGVEIDEVEDVFHFHLIEIDGERVVMALGGDAVDEDMLFSAMHHEVIDEQVVLIINNVGGFHLPQTVFEDDVRGYDTHVGLGLVVEVVVELDDAVHLSADLLCGIVVVPGERGVEFVVGGSEVGDGGHRVTVVEQFADAHVAFEGVARGADVHDTVGILRTVVGEGGDVAFEVDLTGMVVHSGIEHQGLSEHKVDAEESL